MTKRNQQNSPEAWWASSIIEMKPGMIRYRGYAVEDLIGRVSFAEMVWLLTRGELPKPAEAKLLEAALVAAVDHGPQAPSIAVARMAITCGIGINNAMASAINVLGDIHGGAGEQCVAFYNSVAKRLDRTRANAKERRTIIASTPPIRARRAFWSWWRKPRLPAMSPAFLPPSDALPRNRWRAERAERFR